MFTPRANSSRSNSSASIASITSRQGRQPSRRTNDFCTLAEPPVVYILNRKTLEVLGSFVARLTPQDHPPGHQMAADHKGNVYVVQAELAGARRIEWRHRRYYKFAFKGYSPVTKCCQGEGVHAAKLAVAPRHSVHSAASRLISTLPSGSRSVAVPGNIRQHPFSATIYKMRTGEPMAPLVFLLE